MPSKWKTWDFFNSKQIPISCKDSLIIGFSFEDFFLERSLLERLKQDVTFGENWVFLTGSDLSIEYVEQTLLTLDLFGGANPHYIFDAGTIPINSLEKLFDSRDYLSSNVILSFKGNNSNKKLAQKNLKDNFHELLKPPFWEQQKWISFLAKEKNINLPYETSALLEELLPQSTHEYLLVLDIISDLAPDFPTDEVKLRIKNTKLDSFELAKIYGKKNFGLFFEKLTQLNLSYDEWEGFFQFIQGHLVKLLDPSYIERKSKPTKYDNEIKLLSIGFNQKQLKRDLGIFSDLKLMARQKNPKLSVLIREQFLNYF